MEKIIFNNFQFFFDDTRITKKKPHGANFYLPIAAELPQNVIEFSNQECLARLPGNCLI